MKKNILRPSYMRQLIDAQNNGLIKIVSGIRRPIHRTSGIFARFFVPLA